MPDCGSCIRINEGASFFMCTPDKCENGYDSVHGGLFKKDRFDHTWPLDIVATGPVGREFSGNCYGDILPCAEIIPLWNYRAGTPGLGFGPIASRAVPQLPPCRPAWFGQVHAIVFDGLAKVWYDDNCDSYLDCGGGSCDPQALPPPLPGIGLHDTGGDPLCSVGLTGHICTCSMGDFPVCKGEQVWVAMDLNLDGGDRPYRSFTGRNCELPTYTGEGVPRLRDYPVPGGEPPSSDFDCPCETWTGANPCT